MSAQKLAKQPVTSEEIKSLIFSLSLGCTRDWSDTLALCKKHLRLREVVQTKEFNYIFNKLKQEQSANARLLKEDRKKEVESSKKTTKFARSKPISKQKNGPKVSK